MHAQNNFSRVFGLSLGLIATFSFSQPGYGSDELFERLGQMETRGYRSENFNSQYEVVQPQTGCLGKYQLSLGMLQDVGYYDGSRWTGKNGIGSQEDFLRSPDVQDQAIREAFEKNKGYVQHFMREKHGKEVTDLGEIDSRYREFAILGAAHLVGAEAVCDCYDSSLTHKPLRLEGRGDERRANGFYTKAKKYAYKLTNTNSRLSDSEDSDND